MKFTFIEKKMAPSGSLRAYAEKKVSKIDRLFRTESEANVTFSTLIYSLNTPFLFANMDGSAEDVFSVSHEFGHCYAMWRQLQQDGAFEIVRRKRFPIKPMSVEEAILQMDLLEHTFFVFRDVAADGAVSVVYRRKDGGYGLISDATE